MVFENKVDSHQTILPLAQNDEIKSKFKLWSKAHSRKNAIPNDISLASIVNQTSNENPISLAGDSPYPLREYIINWVAEKYGPEMVAKAKEEFYLISGKFFYDEQDYNNRIEYFFDYFLFERRMVDVSKKIDDLPPLLNFISSFDSKVPEYSLETCDLVCNLRSFTHSIFEVRKAARLGCEVTDILSNERLKISAVDGQNYSAIERGQLIQAYTYPWKNERVFSRGTLFHPKDCTGIIKKIAKKQRKEPSFHKLNFLFKLAKTEKTSQIRKPEVIKKTYVSAFS